MNRHALYSSLYFSLILKNGKISEMRRHTQQYWHSARSMYNNPTLLNILTLRLCSKLFYREKKRKPDHRVRQKSKQKISINIIWLHANERWAAHRTLKSAIVTWVYRWQFSQNIEKKAFKSSDYKEKKKEAAALACFQQLIPVGKICWRANQT